MKWLKNVLLDVAVTVVIVLAAAGQEWAMWVVWIYTPCMLLLKLGALTVRRPLVRTKTMAEAPPWFYHLLYGLNVTALLVGGAWLWAGLWALIWVLSMVAEAQKPMVA